jgi:hypothetical protein
VWVLCYHFIGADVLLRMFLALERRGIAMVMYNVVMVGVPGGGKLHRLYGDG